MTPAQINLDGKRAIYQGDYYPGQASILDTDGATPLNLTNYTGLKAQVRDAATPQATQIRAEFACTLADQAASPGVVNLILTEAKTAAMALGNYVWDFEMVNTAGHKQTWIAGSVTVVGEVTRG